MVRAVLPLHGADKSQVHSGRSTVCAALALPVGGQKEGGIESAFLPCAHDPAPALHVRGISLGGAGRGKLCGCGQGRGLR